LLRAGFVTISRSYGNS